MFTGFAIWLDISLRILITFITLIGRTRPGNKSSSTSNRLRLEVFPRSLKISRPGNISLRLATERTRLEFYSRICMWLRRPGRKSSSLAKKRLEAFTGKLIWKRSSGHKSSSLATRLEGLPGILMWKRSPGHKSSTTATYRSRQGPWIAQRFPQRRRQTFVTRNRQSVFIKSSIPLALWFI